ncbi:PREDICTED: putative uncharacterized protein CXorf58 homolog isoform X2 [Myotis brandtii]|uniref:putative uncharacterized protein CXorf58 homolog isoform X2 n=1 Tax=Myotis brandtii TaxID=109478 RepID=UPI0003BBE740|nr:PREDICTED: putative uncharacterized protein CXorf58 homolog isoform X2 [Myotis brandtii]
MSGSSKAGATGDGKSADPTMVKGRKTPLPKTKRTKPVRPTRRDISALKIQRAWLSYMDRTIFQLLKHTICAAEYCVTYDILKNVSPVEAEFLKDAGNKCKVKFRFSGEKFPPFIVFKIFLHTGGYGYKYFSGKNMLKPSSKYSSVLDKTPASSGGRNNCWRRLSLKNIPKTMIMYDIMDYAESRVISRRLRKEMKYLLQKPRTEEMRQNQLRIITQARYLPLLSSQCFYRPSQQQVQFKHLGRRSKQAKMKNEKMKKAYQKEKKASTSMKTEPRTDRPDTKQQRRVVFSAPSFDIVKFKVPLSDDKLEDKEPFFWSQKLYVHRYPPF